MSQSMRADTAEKAERQPHGGAAMAKAGYQTLTMADMPEDGLTTELSDPYGPETITDW